MAAWPVAFEAAVKETARRHLPEAEFSIYIHGHSTGGPFAMMTSQRIPNISGIVGYGTSPFGYMYTEVTGDGWQFPSTGCDSAPGAIRPAIFTKD